MRESPVEASEDSQNDSKPQTQNTSQNSNSETNSKTFVEFDSTPRFRKGFRRKKGESPYVCDMNVKFKKEKKQSTFLNPDPWARLVGSRNTAAIYIDGIATTALYDTGAELELISKEFCEQNKLKIQPIEQLIECKGVVGTGLLEYDGYVEVNVQIPGRDFSEDHLFLVSSMMNSQEDMPVIVGNFFIDSLNKYLKNLSQEEFETLDKTIQNVYFARIEASRIKEQYGCEPPLGFVRTTKAYTIPANSHIGIHGLTKVKHGDWNVNVVNENPQITPLPHGLKTENTLSQLSPGSNRILVAMSNYSDKDITIPAKTIISQLSLGNKIPKMIYPGDEKDSELLDKDEGLKYEHFEQHKLISEELKLEPEEYIPTSCDKTSDQSHTVEIEDLGPDLEEDIEFQNSYTENDKTNLGKSYQPTSSEEDDGSWILKLIDLSGLEKWSDEDKNAAIEMIKRNANVFSKNDMDMGRTNLVKHHIELTDPIPFKESYRRIPPQMYDEVKAHIQEMLDLGAIRHSNSPWASAIVLVRKKDGRLRFCIDLRKLNNRTVKDAYSLPRIETLLDTFLGSTIFTTLDLKAGYWQVEMAEESKAFTAFTCGPLGFYECETMPFGATNAPATFQRLMHNCLGDLNMTWCVVYLDDIIVFSDNPKDHIVRLEAVFQKLASAGLKLKPSKYFFFKEEIDYLGHLVSGKGVATSPKKIEAVTKWPVPQTVYDVRSFLGFVGYYRRFIRDFSKISKPIREVIIGLENQSKRVAKKTLINWSEAAQSAFEILKELCVNAPILAFPDYKLPFILHTDSSTEGLGAVLYQKQEGKLRVIAYASRSVTKTESNYPTHKLEFLALKWAICEKFHEYLYGSTPFEVYTDNNPLTYVLTTAKLDACGQRWVANLANYNFTIQYRSGQSNVEADALSRISWPKVLDGTDTADVENMDTHIVNAIITGARSKSSLIESISSSPEIVPKELISDSNEPTLDWFKLQRADPSLATIIHLMESDQLYKRKPYKKDSTDIKSLLRIKKSLVLTKGILFRKSFTDNTSSKKIIWQLVIPKSHRHQAILGCHDEVGHQERVRTLSLLRERFFWPNMQVEATQHIAKCSRCLKRKSTPQVAPLQPILVSQPLELVHLDYLSLEPSKGNIENVLVITDHFTRYALAYASKTQTAQATARILWDNFICHYGFPEQFISDQGRNFESDLIQELCKIAGVKKLHTTPYHPQRNGQCERFNSTLCNMLGILSDEDKWESEEYIVIEQPIPGTPVYRVRPVTGTKVRTLHRNLLLPLGVKYQPDIDSDDSVCVDTSHSRPNQPEKVSQAKSVRFQSDLPKVGFEGRKGDVSQADSSKVDEDDVNLPISPMESVNQVPDVESGLSDYTGTSEHLIPDDVNLPSQYLVTQSDDSSDMEDTTTTELNVDSQVNEPNTEDDLPFIDSKIDSLVDTNEFLEFVDTLDDEEQTSAIEPKSVTESQFSSVMSYHEGDSTPLRDPSTDSQELRKSLDAESTEELASGTINQEDDSSHDNDVFASDTERSSSLSVQDDSSVQNSNIVQSVEEDEPENVISVEITEPRRSGRERKQTALYGNPLLYTITCKLTPRFVPVFFNKMSETLESLQTNYLMDSKNDDSS